MIKRALVGLVGLAVVVLGAYRAIEGSGEMEPAPDVEEIRRESGIPVEVAEARIGRIEVYRTFTGTLRGIRSATVRARTGDEIVEIPVRVGDRVRAGQVLVRQSSRGSRAAVRQAEAAWRQARRTVERLRPLWEAGAISEQDWDNARTQLEVAEANLEAARKAVFLTSPIDGVVTEILERPGTVPSPGDPLVRVADLSSLLVRLEVSPEEARELAVGQPAVLPELGLEGAIFRIALQASPRTRLLEVELRFPDAPAGIVPGTLVRARIRVAARDSALLVPRRAVREGAAWVVDADGLARHRRVTVGLQGEDEVEIVDGLREGDRVVTAGASLLTEGAKTNVVG